MEEEKKKKKFPLHIRIIVFMILGIVWGIFASDVSWGRMFTIDYIKPLGTIFLKLLQVIAVPIVLCSLIVAIGKLKDMTRLARIGGKTVLLFICTALTATTLGTTLAYFVEPGKSISEETRKKLIATYSPKTETTIGKAEDLKESPLNALIEMVPNNIFSSASDNTRMIQVVIFAILFGIALIKIEPDKSDIVIRFFEGVNDAIIKMVEMIIQVAPIGVFALMAALIVEISGKEAVEILLSLLRYGLTVIAGLIILLFIFYPLILIKFSKVGYKQFFKGMQPAFLMAFTTSSSNATLPVTMERVEKHLGIPKEITGFVIPFGTTINLDGTALYQTVAALFIAQAFGLELTVFQMAVVVLTATISAAGAAGVPGIGMITLVIVLEAINVPAAGLALIMAPDRILDMCRTIVNVAGDGLAAVVVAGTENVKIGEEIEESE